MTAARPKGLIVAGRGIPLVANKPLVLYGLDAMRSAGIREVGIVAGAATGAAIRELADDGLGAGLRLRYMSGGPGASPVEALAAAADFVEDSPCVVQLRDGLMRGDLTPLLDELGRDALDALLLLDPAEPAPEGVAGLDDKRLLRLAGESGRPARLAGVHVLGPRVVREARSGGNLVELLGRVLADGGRARARSFSGSWRPVCEHEDLLEANRVVLDDLHPPGPPEGELVDSRVQGRVLIGPGTRLESTVVRGPVVIGSRVQLRHAYIGPYTSIGDEVEIEGAEIEHSVILPGAIIENLGGRLEASVVGRGAKVFRDFALPRAMRLRIADGDEICLA